jgi:AcrR family transcriptional regulator
MSTQPVSRAGRRPGRQDTRGQILAAARHSFAERGFGGSSMRAIAADAGVDAALIHHYFDSKQQLFLATVELPVPIDELVQSLADRGVDGLGTRTITTILSIWDSELQASLVAAIRAVLAQPEMTAAVGEFLSLEVIGRLLSGLGLPPAEAKRRSALVSSQILGVLVGRYVLKLEPLVAQSSADLVAAIGPTLQRYLEGDIA